MQVVIALPAAVEMERLDRSICGVPLLTRVIAAAVRAGATRLLLVIPPGWPIRWVDRILRFEPIESLFVDAVAVPAPLDANDTNAWRRIAGRLDEQFLWAPYDYLAHRPELAGLLAIADLHPRAELRLSMPAEARPVAPIFQQPAVLLKRDVLEGAAGTHSAAILKDEHGISARPPARVRDIEAELVRRSGKPTDGIYSRFNRKLCRPVVRWLSHTPVTPNVISFVGLLAAVVAGLCFAKGAWAWDVAGGLWFFISGLFDEIDGMLARLKFRESAFGCWLETYVDYATYLLAFAGMMVGGYRRGNPIYLWVGAALLIGCLLAFFTISVQRRLTSPSQPTDYYRRYLKALDRDARNPVSKAARTFQFLLRKGVLIHYILLFSVLDLIPVVFFLSAVGANAAWIMTVYLNRRLFIPENISNQRPAHLRVQAEVKQ